MILNAFPSDIPNIISTHINESNLTFVFPTDIAVSSWVDWAVSHPEITGTTAIALERFTAWDTFKSSMMNAKIVGRKSIPSLLRKLFVRNLISQNAECAAEGKPIFKSLINPYYAENAYSFTDWVSKILPSLEQWHTKYEAWCVKQNDADADDENADFCALYTLYKKYLDDHALFEPSWITPDFKMNGDGCIIFFPETFEDFGDYRDMLANADGVTLVMLPDTKKHSEVSFYSNSRTELHACALAIRRLISEKKASWSDIAVSTTNMNVWRPYIEREFSLYCIPFVTRAGEPYTANGAGRVFSEMQDCCESEFSYESVRALLLDGYVPWKEQTLNDNIVREGCKRKCICSFTENGSSVDSWERGLNPSNTDNTTEREYTAYCCLKKMVTAICNAKTFSGIQKAWFIFRSEFFDNSLFSTDADLILGRCLMVLSELIDIENEFFIPYSVSVPRPYDFFLNEIKSSIYQRQADHVGVSLFPYRLSACAHFKYQFILDSSQKQLTVPYRSLSFLNKKKRKELLGADTDTVSDAFVRLYAEKDIAFFSASEQTFGGFAIPYSFLSRYPETGYNDAVLVSYSDEDFINKEIFALRNEKVFPTVISVIQQEGFSSWMHRIAVQPQQYTSISPALRDRITYLLSVNRKRSGECDGIIHISQTDLTAYFTCPRSWLFGQVFRIAEDSLDTALMEPYDAGAISHRMLELFMKSYQEKKLSLPCTAEDGTLPGENDLHKALIACAEMTFQEKQYRGSPLVQTALESQKELFADNILKFLRIFCRAGGGFGGYSVIGLESWMNGKLQEEGYAYTGRLDCILCDDTGGATIIDYKNTFAALPHLTGCIADEEGTITDFQMPVYISLWNESNRNSTTNKIENALFYSINGAHPVYVVQNEGRTSHSQSVTTEGYEKTLAACHTYAVRFTDDVRSGSFGIDSKKVDRYEVCLNCTYKTICRTAYITSGVNIPSPFKTEVGK